MTTFEMLGYRYECCKMYMALCVILVRICLPDASIPHT